MWTLVRDYATVTCSITRHRDRLAGGDAVNGGKARVLIFDEDAVAQRAATVLAASDCAPETAQSEAAALLALEQHDVDVMLCAVSLNGTNGIDLLRKVHVRRPSLPIVMVADDPSISRAVAAMRQGAFDYVTKPLDDEELRAIVARALEMTSLRRENGRLRQQLNVASMTADFVADSQASRALVAMIRRVAPARSTVLIEGESGTGKELVARMLHHWSNRAAGPFIAVNCKAFADSLMESELFGHEKGSFTGAIAARAGCFERASGGTLFLDEIAEAGGDFQAKLLRVLEDGEVMRVGASRPRHVDVRIVAATNRVLRTEVARNRFRGDLYFRLNVIPVRTVPLRERPDDIMPLAQHFLALHSAEAGRQISLLREAERTLTAHAWPGNVRELENAIERAVVLSGADVLTPEAFQLESDPPARSERSDDPTGATAVAAVAVAPDAFGPELLLQQCLDLAAGVRIKEALKTSNGSRAEAAVALGVDRTTLYRLIKRLEL
jgi:DNA-binding NtrC family response regulator